MKAAVFVACVVVILAVSIIWLALVAALVMTGWNAVLPDAFGFPALVYWQAFVITLLFHLLTGGFSVSLKVRS